MLQGGLVRVWVVASLKRDGKVGAADDAIFCRAVRVCAQGPSLRQQRRRLCKRRDLDHSVLVYLRHRMSDFAFIWQKKREVMRNLGRGYATVGHLPSRLRARGKAPLGLDHFIQRQRALALWRDIVRSTASISDASTRNDMRQFARTEFEQHKHVTDLGHIRYLISVRLLVQSMGDKY